ncbi:MAG: hypothetical protein ACRDHZ_14335 [Ktedonobacteraceae bacterium]
MTRIRLLVLLVLLWCAAGLAWTGMVMFSNTGLWYVPALLGTALVCAGTVCTGMAHDKWWAKLPRNSRERRKLAVDRRIVELERWHKLWEREDGIRFAKQPSECLTRDPYGYGAKCLLELGHPGLHTENYGDGWVSKWA